MERIEKKYTTFITDPSNYYYNVMPFGLKNTDTTYQRMINKVFGVRLGTCSKYTWMT